MKLRRVAIRNFRRLRDPVCIEAIGDGLTVISGDNEEGKSTLLMALKAGLFEHHTVGGKIRERMTPHGGGVPAVDIDFDVGDEHYELRKRFQRGGVSLRLPSGRTLEGDEAEDRLRAMLCFERRTKQEAQPENLGVQSLFWVDQGTTFQAIGALSASRDRFATLIEGEIGAVVQSDASRRVIQSVSDQYARFWDRRGKERGELVDLRHEIGRREGEAQAIRERRIRYDALVDALRDARERRRRFYEAGRLARAAERKEKALAEIEQIHRLEADKELLDQKVKIAAAKHVQLVERRQGRQQIKDDLARDEAALIETEERMLNCRQERQNAEGTHSKAAEANTAAAKDLSALYERLRQAQAAREAALLRVRMERLDEALGEVDKIAKTLTALRVKNERIAATPERLNDLRSALAACEQARIALHVAATRLEFHPDARRQARHEGRPLDQMRPLDVTDRTELELEGFGRLVVIPGGSDLVERRARVQDAEEAVRTALVAADCGSLDGAEQALRRKQEIERQLGSLEAGSAALLRAHGASHRDALDLERRRIEVELHRLLRLAGDPEDLHALANEENGLRERLAEEERVLDVARADLDAAGKRLHRAKESVATVEGERRAFAARVAQARIRLDEAVSSMPDEQLNAELEEAQRAELEARNRLDRLISDIAMRDPEGWQARHDIAERELADLEAERDRLDRAESDLAAQIRGAGTDAFDDRLDELERELAASRLRLGRLEAQARAWRLLKSELDCAEEGLRNRLSAPIRARVEPLLQRLFPSASVRFDGASLSLVGVSRNGSEEDYEALSVGTREQVSVLVRLAFAQLMHEREGEAPCVILDDALVYADEARFEIMKTILKRAAMDLQIIILTCRPRDFLGLDARRLRLEECSVDVLVQ